MCIVQYRGTASTWMTLHSSLISYSLSTVAQPDTSVVKVGSVFTWTWSCWGPRHTTHPCTTAECRGCLHATDIVIFTALHAMQTLSSDEKVVRLSVRASVRLSNAW